PPGRRAGRGCAARELCQAEASQGGSMDKELIGRALQGATTAIAFETNRVLRVHAAGRHVLETSKDIEVLPFARAGHIEATLAEGHPNEVLTNWAGPEEGLVDRPENAWIDVVFEGKRIEAMRMCWRAGWDKVVRWWIVADDEATARAFLDKVSAWS